MTGICFTRQSSIMPESIVGVRWKQPQGVNSNRTIIVFKSDKEYRAFREKYLHAGRYPMESLLILPSKGHCFLNIQQNPPKASQLMGFHGIFIVSICTVLLFM